MEAVLIIIIGLAFLSTLTSLSNGEDTYRSERVRTRRRRR